MCRLSHISGHFRLNLSDHERVKYSGISAACLHAVFGCVSISKIALQRYDSIEWIQLHTPKCFEKVVLNLFVLADYQIVAK